MEEVSGRRVSEMPVTWFFGRHGAGKSFLVNKLASVDKTIIVLDGDEMRTIWTDLGFSKKDRYEQNIRIARLAKLFSDKGFEVLCATILPYQDLREKVKEITNCRLVYVQGGTMNKQDSSSDDTFEPPTD